MARSVGKPRVYISYSWRTPQNKERALELAERLRANGIDSRIDLYNLECRHGFLPPEARTGDSRDPWNIWQEQEIKAADRVLILCTPEYYECVDHSNGPSGAWSDGQFMRQDLASGAQPIKFIPVGFGSYSQNEQFVPAFIKGATYFDLSPAGQPVGFDGLMRRFRTEFPRARSGVFISYSHKDKKWLDLLLQHLAPARQSGMEIWTDQEIEPGDLWHDEIQERLDGARVAVPLITPSFLASSYVSSHELPTMLTAAESEGLTIFWIPVSDSSYKTTPIQKFQAAHDPSRPLAKLSGAKRAEALVDIVAKLSKALTPAKAAQSGTP